MADRLVQFDSLFLQPTRNGLTRPKAVRGTGTKMVNMGELFAHPRIQQAEMDRVPLSDSEAERYLLVDGDLLFARQSLVFEGAGKCSIFLGDREDVTFESHVTRVRLDQNKADPLFYFYYLQSHQGRSAIRGIVEQGAGASGIRGSDLARIQVQYLPLDEQRRIAHILGTLDDKIEINRQMNKTLDEIARTLFRSWFVDFDPVRAKMEGRQPDGMDAATAALFPDRLVDSELGPIPEGWEVKVFTDLVEVMGGGTPKTGIPQYWGGNIPWFAMADLPNDGSYFVTKTTKTITEEGERNSSAKRVPEGATILTARGTVGEVVIAGEEMSFNQSCYALRPLDATIGPLSVHLLTRSLVSLLKTRTHGSVFQTITRSTLGSLEVVDPGAAVWNSFELTVESLFALMHGNAKENHSLGDLRDTLLDELLSSDSMRTNVELRKSTGDL